MVTTVAILKRRLREGKTYDDFRKAWYHTVGFGTKNRMYTLLNIADPKEVIVIGFTESDTKNLIDGLRIDVKERLAHPLDEVIEPEIDRTFGLLLSDDDFSPEGSIAYREPSIGGTKTDINEIMGDIATIRSAFDKAARERDTTKG